VKKARLIGLIGLLACALSAAESSSRDKIVTAAKLLGDKPNYSWSSFIREEGDGRSGQNPGFSGKVIKGGPMCLISMAGATREGVYMNGQKGAAKGTAGWQTLDEIAKPGGFAAAIVRYLRSIKTPSAECGALGGELQNVKEEKGAISGDLKEASAKEYLEFYIPPYAGQAAPKIADPKGTAKFWIKEGMPTRYEINVECKVIRGDKESEYQRTTTVEIKDVGTTKLEVPEEAKQKLL
jgi:hypothetical protein